MAVQIQFRRGLAADWTTADPTLAAGEFAIETDTDFYKIGDGATAWTSLGYSSFPAGSAPLASPTFTGTVTMADLVVNGTTSTINSATLTVDDKNIELGSVATPTDTTADGGGITLKGATDKTFNWVDSTDAWTSSEHVALATGKSIYIDSVLQLSKNALAATVVLADGVAGTTQSANDSTTKVATTAFVMTEVGDYATLASPTLTGTPAAPTASANTNTTQVATTAFVMTEVGDYAPLASPTLTGTATMDVGIQKAVSIVAENGNFTLDLTHAGKLISLGGGASQNITVPPNSSVAFPTGTQIAFFDEQTGGGINTFVEGSGVTIRSKDSNKKMDGDWTTVVLIKQATNTWYLFGPLTS